MDTRQLFRCATRSFRDLAATLLTEDSVPDDFGAILELFKSRKSDLGRKEFAGTIGLNIEELGEFERCLSELAKRTKNAIADSTNEKIACLRILSWLETIETRECDFQVDPEIALAVSEELGRKKVRALELVIRSLVSERHGSQQQLANHLTNLFGDRTVDRWAKVADAEDLLSGTTFSELASIFVNKDEFAHHQKLYEDADVVNLLKERRKTAQNYLEDIRRFRNTMAHNKKVTNIQLSLLDLYYDQLISPVQTGFSNGQTQTNPQAYFDATAGQIQNYFGDLKQDVMSVQDDISNLKAAMQKQIANVQSQGKEIATTTRGIDRKLIATLALLMPIAAAVGYGIYVNSGTDKKVSELEQAASAIGSSTDEINKKSDTIIAEQTELNSKTDSLVAKTTNIASTANRVEKSTQAMAESNNKILGTVSEIADSSKNIAQSIAKIQNGFTTLSQAGGIIANPKLPQEVFHNARLYEQRGDYANARKSYVQFFDFKLALVDPHLRFQSFLKLQEGLEGAREIYRTLKEQHNDDTITFAAILLEPTEKRKQMLQEFVESHPEFAPAYYALSQEFSSTRLGTQDIGDMADEKKYLERFLELKEQGEFVKFMLDKSVAEAQLKDAQQRLTQLGRINQEALKNPVTLSGMMTNQGWMITIQITGNPKEILYRTDPAQDFKSTGHMQAKNFTTGNPLPNMSVNMETMAGSTNFEVKYIDANDKERGPFEIKFEPESELISSQKKILEMMPQSWVSFRDYDGKTLVYFSHLLSYRSAIKDIWYGLDKETPDTLYKIAVSTESGIIEHHKPFDQGDRKNPGALQENEIPCFAVSGDTKFITVKVQYLDGTESEIVRIKR